MNSSSNNQFLIVMDFLFQKFEIEYENNMTATDVIKKVQQFLFPSERGEELIYSPNDEVHKKLRLYRGTPAKYTEAIPVTEPITKEETKFEAFQFYLFRPIVNVLIIVYIVEENNIRKENNIAKFEIVYPVKKKVSLLKNYVKETLLKYTKEANIQVYNLLQKEFTLQYDSSGKYVELKDEQYVEHWMSGKDTYLVINKKKDSKQNTSSLGRFYYFSFGDNQQNQGQQNQGQQNQGQQNTTTNSKEKEADSLDYDGDVLTLSKAKKKLL